GTVGVEQALQQSGRDQRGVAGQHQHVAGPLEQGQGGGQGVAGAPLAGLDGEGDRAEVEVPDGLGDLAGAVADDDHGPVGLEGGGGGEPAPKRRRVAPGGGQEVKPYTAAPKRRRGAITPPARGWGRGYPKVTPGTGPLATSTRANP